jgi:hypothetical protein
MANRHKNQRSSSVKWFLLCSLAAFLILPCTLYAEPLVLSRIIDEIDASKLSEIRNLKLSVALKTDKKGDLVVRCLNLFNIPVAQNPFEGSPGLQKLAQRTSLQVNQKGSAVYVKLAIAF